MVTFRLEYDELEASIFFAKRSALDISTHCYMRNAGRSQTLSRIRFYALR